MKFSIFSASIEDENPTNHLMRLNKLFLAAISIFALAQSSFAQSSYVNFEGKQTSPVRLSTDGTKLFAVNTPDARLSVFDVTLPSNPILLAEIPVGVEPVSVNPRTADEVWVVNEVSDSISVVSISQRIVTDTIYVKDEPADVVFAGGKAFVSCSRNNQIRVFDVTNHTQLAAIPLVGENPRALCVSADGTKVYAAFALSGNRTTLVPPDKAPKQPTNATPPMNPSLPAPPQVGLIVDATDTNWTTVTNVIKYTMPDNDVVEISVSSMAVIRYFPRIGTVNLAIAIRPSFDQLFVANTDARNLVRFEPNVRGHIVDNRVTRIGSLSGIVPTITPFDLNPGINYNQLPNLSAMSNALAQPTAIAFDPSGSFMFVAAFGSDRVARVDSNGNVLSRIEIGPATGASVNPATMRGPRGLALHATAQRLYVLNRISNTISILDTSNDSLLKEFPIGSFDPTPAVIRNGRGFLYDAKLSGNGTASCAACHIDAEMDLIAWDLGDPTGQMASVTNTTLPGVFQLHPMKGPMTTQTLRGLNALDPLHWRGDRTNFLHFNGAFDGLMGGTTLTNSDMAAYRAFINTIAFEPNPNQNLDRSFPTNFAGGNAVAGRNTFLNETYQPLLSCNACHSVLTGSNRQLIAGAALQESQDFKVPHLRNVYQKLNFNNKAGAASIGGFGIVHDGMDPTLTNFLSRPVFGSFANDTTRKNNLNAFVQCFDTGTAPAVGYTRTAVATNVNSLSLSNDWTLLELQAAQITNIDFIVKGKIDGELHGFIYQPAFANYKMDTTNSSTLTRAQLRAKILAGDTLTLMGVPPGSGTRIGIDRNLDGILDADTPKPFLRISQVGSDTVIRWPYSSAGFLLEETSAFGPTAWTNLSAPSEIVADENVLTNPPSAAAKFFRLRRP
ncbi:MAG: beta-propeller fold lactonase family protein [Verrucomicrobiota bacterium]